MESYSSQPIKPMNSSRGEGSKPRFDPCVFILGCDRSGTTLLQNLLTSHSKLFITYEAPFAVVTKHLYSPESFTPLIEAIDAFPQLDNLDRSVFLQDLDKHKDYEFSDFVGLIYRHIAAGNGKTIWGDKTPGYTTKVPVLADLFQNARFIHIVRDPRAVAFSWAPTFWGPNTVMHASREWLRHVTLAQPELEKLGSNRAITLHFEDLVERPEQELSRICDFLQIDYESQMLDSNERMKAAMPTQSSQHLHKNRTGEMNAKRSDSWRSKSKISIATVESICWEQMKEFGYEPISESKPSLSKVKIFLYKVINRILIIRNYISKKRQGVVPPPFPPD